MASAAGQAARPTVAPDTAARRIPVQEGVGIDVCWRDGELSRGPAASLFVSGCEAVRLDCFGADQGHLHLWLDGKVGRRWYFPTAPATVHVERAAFELARNHAVLLAACRDPRLDLLRERAVSN